MTTNQSTDRLLRINKVAIDFLLICKYVLFPKGTYFFMFGHLLQDKVNDMA